MNKKSRLVELQLEKEKLLLQQKNDQLKYKHDVIQQKNKELNYFLQNIIKYIREISESENFRKFKKQIFDRQFLDSSLSFDAMFQLGKQIIELTDNYTGMLEQIPQSEFLYKSQQDNDIDRQQQEMNKILEENKSLKQKLEKTNFVKNKYLNFQIAKNFEYKQNVSEDKSELDIQYSINSIENNTNSKVDNSLLQSSKKNSIIDEDFSTPQFEIYKNNQQINDQFQLQRGCSKNLQQELDKFLENQNDSNVYVENDFKSPQKQKKSSQHQSQQDLGASQDQLRELKELQNMNILCSIDQDQNEHFEKIKRVYQQNPDLFCKFFNVSDNDKLLLIEKFEENQNAENNIQQNFTKKCNLISFQNIDNNMTIQETTHDLYVNSCENIDNIEEENYVQSIYSNRQLQNNNYQTQQKNQETSITVPIKTQSNLQEIEQSDFKEQEISPKSHTEALGEFLQRFGHHTENGFGNQFTQSQNTNTHQKNSNCQIQKNFEQQINSMNLKNSYKAYYSQEQNQNNSELFSNNQEQPNTSIQRNLQDDDLNKVNINISQRYGSNNADSFSQKLSIKKSQDKFDKSITEKSFKFQENLTPQQNYLNKKKQNKKLKMDFSPSITKKLQVKVDKIIVQKQKSFQDKLNEKNQKNRLCLPFSYTQQQTRKSKINNNQKKSFKNLSNIVKKTKKMQKSQSFIDKKPYKKKKIDVSSSSDEDMQIVTKEVIPLQEIMRDEKPLKNLDSLYNQKKYKKSFKDFEKCFAKIGTKSQLKKFY